MGDIITCPSGLKGEIRGLTGQDARLLGDRQLVRSGMFLDKILDKCWLETHDPGPYGFGEEKPDWSKVLVGDRFYIFIRIRIRSFGPDFDCQLQCTNPSCRERFTHKINLEELTVNELSEEDKELFAADNKIEGELPDGNKFWFRLPVGADEVKAARMGVNSVTSFIGPMVARIWEIEGLSEVEKRKYFEDGELGLAYAALREMDAHDCGIETNISVECPACYNGMDVEIPFGLGFLAPGLTGKKEPNT